MKKITLALAAVIGIGMLGVGTSEVQAASPFGFHFGSGGLHVDVGNVHHGYRTHRTYRNYGGHNYGGHYDYHNTSHYDWHPGSVTRHRNHYDYVPGHYDWHSTGHYDYHGGRHGYRGSH